MLSYPESHMCVQHTVEVRTDLERLRKEGVDVSAIAKLLKCAKSNSGSSEHSPLLTSYCPLIVLSCPLRMLSASCCGAGMTETFPRFCIAKGGFPNLIESMTCLRAQHQARQACTLAAAGCRWCGEAPTGGGR